MEESLKLLSDDDLRPMSEAIENMDNIEASIAGLKTAYDSANRLRAVYDKYNSGVLYYKAEAFINARNSLNELQKKASELTEDITLNEETIVRETNIIEKLNQRKAQLDDKLQKYRETDIYKLNQRIMELESEINAENDKLNDKEDAKERREDAKRRAEADLRVKENEYELKECAFSDKRLTDTAVRSLCGVQSGPLKNTVQLMIETGFAGYQENILKLLIDDLNRSLPIGSAEKVV